MVLGWYVNCWLLFPPEHKHKHQVQCIMRTPVINSRFQCLQLWGSIWEIISAWYTLQPHCNHSTTAHLTTLICTPNHVSHSSSQFQPCIYPYRTQQSSKIYPIIVVLTIPPTLATTQWTALPTYRYTVNYKTNHAPNEDAKWMPNNHNHNHNHNCNL